MIATTLPTRNRVATRQCRSIAPLLYIALCNFAAAGCTVERDPPLDVAHPFERAIYGVATDDRAVVRRAANEVEKLVGSDRTVDTFERMLLAQKAVCSREISGTLRCSYRKRNRYQAFLNPPMAIYYELAFIVRSQPQELSLTVCYGVNYAMGKWDEVPEFVVPDKKHCGR